MRTQKVSTRAALSAAALVGVLVLAACSSTTSTDEASPAAEPTATTAAPVAPAPPAQGTTQNASVAGSFITLDEYQSNKAKYADNDVVLFFNATWCSTCQEANKNLNASKGEFPDGLTVVSVDYDSNTDLRKEYGVTTQHTFVQISPDGTEIKKWSGSSTVGQIEAKV